ncbi:hypothetical protein BD309DRAFT_867846 [Dichomitus squalens]|uniref:Uncharacterized protein n=1 Tax=Dichomitus squalens TaxID=114155 RepID=A0A4Q9NPE8_9APHY|nr:hypothetical protein BD309DRAFT_867846 [Dichomitus squalens]TBU64285.1 hypothetical protein BD310DRAFT_972702 [Dichomitus squalens]
MNSERADRTVLVESALAPDDLRAAFAQCGVIRGMYAAGPSSDSALFRYHVEYRDQEAVGRARSLQFSKTAVYSVDLQSFVQYFNSALLPDPHLTPEADVRDDLRWSPYKVRHRVSKTRTGRDKYRFSTHTRSEPATSATHLPHPAPELRLPVGLESITTEDRSYRAPDPSCTVTKQSLISATIPSVSANAYTDPSFPVRPPRIPSPVNATSSSPSAFASGSMNMQALDMFPNARGGSDDLHPGCLDLFQVISSLRANASGVEGRGKWIMAAIDYLRLHDILAAIRVLTTMMEVMQGNGLDEADLRPALLLLANCCREMSKKLRHTPGDAGAMEESKQYATQSIELFRKVYGSSGPPPIFDGFRVPQASSPLAAGTLLAPFDPTRSQVASRTTTPLATSSAELASRHGTPNAISAENERKKMLERKIQSLRDRLRTQEESLDQERCARRKVEDRLDLERLCRQTLEEQLKTAEESAIRALRGEESALDQCRAELEMRRQSEERIAELRDRIAMLERKLEEVLENDMKTKDYLRRMGLSLMKAANGDLAISPVLASS